jgi:dTMP kinase
MRNPPGSPKGLFIAIEGAEGCGKSTQVGLLTEALSKKGIDVIATREPGGTLLGERVRELVLETLSEPIEPRAEALLMAAQRAQHVARLIRPSLEAGKTVVVDRFSGSTLAYQGAGRGLDSAGLVNILDWATDGLWPDLNLLLDVPEEVAFARRCARESNDRFEKERRDFHARVMEGFRELARSESSTWAVIDATGTPEEVLERVLQAVSLRLLG